MKLSKMGIARNKVLNIDAQFPVQDILSKTGQLTQYSSGIYAYDNIPFLLKNNIKRIISEELTKAGCVEVSLPVLQPESIWEASGRLDKYVSDDVMFRTITSKGNYCLAPTAEEAIVEFAKNRLQSYKSLPVTYFQIGEKFRNELRARGFLLRGKSFEMMDAYSFNVNSDDLDKTYAEMKQAYFNIFNRLGMNVFPVGADSGSIGGKKSEEFMVISDLGEDTVLYNNESGQAINSELLELSNAMEYLKEIYNIDGIEQLEKKRTLELGHIFQLGTKYSESMGACYISESGKQIPYEMGCYGIGVSRVLAYVYEKNAIYDKNQNVIGYSLPLNLAPYHLHMITNDNKDSIDLADNLYNELIKNGVSLLYDDRNDLSLGAKIKDAHYMGTPYLLILGNKVDDKYFEIENTKTNEKISIDRKDFVNILKTLSVQLKIDESITLENLVKDEIKVLKKI